MENKETIKEIEIKRLKKMNLDKENKIKKLKD